MFNASSCQKRKKNRKKGQRDKREKGNGSDIMAAQALLFMHKLMFAISYSVSVRAFVCLIFISTTNSQYIMPYISAKRTRTAYHVLTFWQLDKNLSFLSTYMRRPNIWFPSGFLWLCSFWLDSFNGKTIARLYLFVLFSIFYRLNNLTKCDLIGFLLLSALRAYSNRIGQVIYIFMHDEFFLLI